VKIRNGPAAVILARMKAGDSSNPVSHFFGDKKGRPFEGKESQNTCLVMGLPVLRG